MCADVYRRQKRSQGLWRWCSECCEAPVTGVGTQLKSSGRTGSGARSLAPAVVVLHALIKYRFRPREESAGGGSPLTGTSAQRHK